MRPLTSAELLDVWERASVEPLHERALIALAAAFPEYDNDALMQLSIGRRDGLLLKLRECTFGTRLSAVGDCPGCNERLEFSFSSDDIRAPQTAVECNNTLEAHIEGTNIRFRLPNVGDLRTIAHHDDVAAAMSELIRRCIDLNPAGISASILNRVEQEMSAADPQANV